MTVNVNIILFSLLMWKSRRWKQHYLAQGESKERVCVCARVCMCVQKRTNIAGLGYLTLYIPKKGLVLGWHLGNDLWVLGIFCPLRVVFRIWGFGPHGIVWPLGHGDCRANVSHSHTTCLHDCPNTIPGLQGLAELPRLAALEACAWFVLDTALYTFPFWI